ncbi:FecR family protein [Pedobacter cryoconitis]|uniref:Ferric-dicitrate binding protein FerR (Iron transport regulator) n=1 Tax=Pedobacter cryoconitis TaxID=188932 RepID=A0A7X0ML15_9SPHI|nr:FecR domain-containing protein [Pedobacter cryoconitis]MBB6502774.1 ferric-dicitrate binding protein FerR (iron transport regulator) [Pedobacter cryoconitis]
MEDKKLAEDLLKKYLEAKATPKEIEQVENWYNSYEGKNQSLSKGRKAIIERRMLDTLKQHIGTPSRKLFILDTSFLRIAATTIMVCGIGFGYWKLAPRTQTEQPADAQLAISTNTREKKTITLSDGSEIILNPSSQLKYPARFSSASREISLVEGEAFFKIAHDERRPFSVQLPEKLYTRVLGTSFTIRAFKASRKMNISVSTGKVAVGNKNQVFGTLIKGQQITYDKNKQSALISQSPVPDTKIVFDGITLRQAMNKLEYVYSIKIDLSPAKMGNMGCTATFHSKQTPEEILGILSSLYNFKFKIAPDHKSFKIYKK